MSIYISSFTSAIFFLGGNAEAANLVEIDFNSLAPETVVTDQFTSVGVTFSLVDNPPLTEAPPNPGPLALPLNLDFTPASGIGIYAGGSCCNPQTDIWFDVELDFTKPIDYFSILALDADEPVSALGFFEGELVQSISFPSGSDTQVYQLELGEIGGNRLFDEVVLDIDPLGPEAFDNLSYNVSSVPESSMSLSLLLVGGIGLYLASRSSRVRS